MLLETFTKSTKIPINKEIFVYTIAGVNMLVLSTSLGSRYLVLPHYVTVFRDLLEFKISFSSFVKLDLQTSFISKIRIWLRNVDKLCRSKLVLKGLGYKASLSGKSKLNLKLGYSHVLTLDIPTDRINVKIIKSIITVKGHDLTEIGNFARRIRCFRSPDAYKGKGVWSKNEHRVLKELRKK